MKTRKFWLRAIRTPENILCYERVGAWLPLWTIIELFSMIPAPTVDVRLMLDTLSGYQLDRAGSPREVKRAVS